MAFSTSMEMTDSGIAKIALSGELDASAAGDFRADIENASAQDAKRLVLLMEDLEYMSSAGLRVLVFAKQKMGSNVDIYLVGVQDLVLEPIQMTGLHHSVILLDEYDASEIETL